MSGKPLLTTCSESSDGRVFDVVCTISKRCKLQQIAGNKGSLLTHSIEFWCFGIGKRKLNLLWRNINWSSLLIRYCTAIWILLLTTFRASKLQLDKKSTFIRAFWKAPLTCQKLEMQLESDKQLKLTSILIAWLDRAQYSICFGSFKILTRYHSDACMSEATIVNE